MSRGGEFDESFVSECYQRQGLAVPESVKRQLNQPGRIAVTHDALDRKAQPAGVSHSRLRELQRQARREVNAELDAEPDAGNPVLALTLPMPPSVNHMYANAEAGGGRVMLQMAKDWKDDAREDAGIIASAVGWKLTRHSKIVVEITAFWPDSRYPRDMNNLHKPLADALEGVIYANDRMALLRDMDFFTDTKNPRVELKIYQKEMEI